MSLILEALKKIEKDNNGNTQKANLAAAILQPDRRGKRRKVLLMSGLILSAAVLLFAAGAGMNHLFSVKGQKVKLSETVQTTLPPKTAALSTPSASGATAIPERPAEVSLEPLKPIQTEARQPVAAKPPAAIHSVAKRGIRQDAEMIQPVKPASASRQPQRVLSNASEPEEDASLKVSGIIWAEESGARRALVNGLSVKEGDIVDGARVERIETHHIHFSKDGKRFDVPIR